MKTESYFEKQEWQRVNFIFVSEGLERKDKKRPLREDMIQNILDQNFRNPEW